MNFDFDDWNLRKQVLNNRTSAKIPDFREGDVWWCSLGLNIGSEENGKGNQFARPVLILSKFNMHTFVGVPLTTKVKNTSIQYVLESVNGIERSVLLQQIRHLDARRLNEFMFTASDRDLLNVKEKIRQLFA